jgi:hypothetical protein
VDDEAVRRWGSRSGHAEAEVVGSAARAKSELRTLASLLVALALSLPELSFGW